MIPISSSLVSGYSKDFFGGKEVIFDYSKGASLVNSIYPRVAFSHPNVTLECGFRASRG